MPKNEEPKIMLNKPANGVVGGTEEGGGDGKRSNLIVDMFGTIVRSCYLPIRNWCVRVRSSYAFARLRARCKFWQRQTLVISTGDCTYTTNYLGNVPTLWAKGEQSIEGPLRILWRNYERRRGKKAPTRMRVTVCNTGIRVVTREVGEVEYWSNRITYVAIVPTHPRILFWVYRHTGKRGRPDLRCHAVLCRKASHARLMAEELQVRLFNNLREFRKEISARAARGPHQALPVRKRYLVKGMHYFKQPLERSQSAPKLDSIVEDEVEEEAAAADHEAVFNNLGHSLFSVSTGQLNF